MQKRGAEEARNQLPELLDAAEKGQPTVISKRGRPVAALVPLQDYMAAARQQPLISLAGTGRGLWGKNSSRTIGKLRGEWTR